MILHTVLQAHLQWLEYSLVSFSNCTASIWPRHNRSHHFAQAVDKPEAFHTAAPSNRAHHSCDGIACSPCAGWNMVCTFSLSSSGAGRTICPNTYGSIHVQSCYFVLRQLCSYLDLPESFRVGLSGHKFFHCHQADALRRSCSKAIPSPSRLQSEHPKPEVPSVLPAKANNLKPYDYFGYLLTEIPKYVEDKNTGFLEELLPWSKTLPEHIRKPKKTSDE